eukprot:scaffold207613_cov19-Tisochrysis_lutea.AAC.1
MPHAYNASCLTHTTPTLHQQRDTSETPKKNGECCVQGSQTHIQATHNKSGNDAALGRGPPQAGYCKTSSPSFVL